MIKVWTHGLIKDDNQGFPDKSHGFFSTTDICKTFSIPMETLQQWLKDGYVCPAYRVDYGRGQKSIFVRSQLMWLGVYIQLISRGVSRKMASNWSNAFFNKMKEKGSFDFFDLLFVEFEKSEIVYIEPMQGKAWVKSSDYGHDVLILNLRRIICKIKEAV